MGLIELLALLLMLLLYLLFATFLFGVVLATPVAAAVLLGVGMWRLSAWAVGRRRAGRPATRERALVEADLREQYVAGTLTLAGLERRTADALAAESRAELETLVGDLPPRATPRRPADVLDVAAGCALMLLPQPPAGRIVGAALVLAAVAPSVATDRFRPLASAFLAGLALFLAPLGALALVGSLAWRRCLD
jgi:hypothetical protein